MTPYVAGVVKRLTRRIVAPLCVGSSPTTRPIFFYLKTGNEGPLARRFLYMGVSPSGKATDSDSVIRRFKSCYPSCLLVWFWNPKSGFFLYWLIFFM